MPNVKYGTLSMDNADGTKDYIYPRTDASVVKFGDSTVEAELTKLNATPPRLFL